MRSQSLLACISLCALVPVSGWCVRSLWHALTVHCPGVWVGWHAKSLWCAFTTHGWDSVGVPSGVHSVQGPRAQVWMHVRYLWLALTVPNPGTWVWCCIRGFWWILTAHSPGVWVGCCTRCLGQICSAFIIIIIIEIDKRSILLAPRSD